MSETSVPKKRHRLKQGESGVADEMRKHDSFFVLACDLSLRRPGFALLRCVAGERYACLLGEDSVDNKTAKKSHGEILAEIGDKLKDWMPLAPCVLVRERGFSRYNNEVQALFKVVGVTDYIAWKDGQNVFEEISPVAVKKLVTGKAKATKDEVAYCLSYYVGDQKYRCDDESDAAAVGISWLIQNDFIDQHVLEVPS